MVNRIGGLASGMDIDALVEKLMSAERVPLNKLFQNKTRYEWQRDAYREVNKKLKTLDTYIADNLVLKPMNSKTASSSNSNLVSATATGKASGTLSIEGVSQLAEAGRITGPQGNATGSTKMKDIASGTITFTAVQADGTMAKEPTEIVITEDMTVNDFVNKVNESGAGVSAVFENGRFSFTAKNTGKGGLEISGDTSKLTGGVSIGEGKNAIFQVNGIATERSSNTFSINGYNVTLKSVFNAAQSTAERYNAAYKEWKNTTDANYKKDIKDAEDAKNTADTAYTKAKNDYENAKLQDPQEQAKYDTLGTTFLSGLTTDEIDKVKNLPKTEADFDKEIADWKANGTDEEKALAEKLSKLSAKQKETLRQTSDTELDKMTQLAPKQLEHDAKLKEKTTADNAHQALVDRQVKAEADFKDAYKNQNNGTEYDASKGDPGEASVPGSTESAVTLSSTTNVDDMMTKIKEFVATYNGLVKGFKDQTTESKYRDFAPLSEEQKKDMTENEIKQWEEKAKSGLLRSDALIQDGLSKMRALVYETNPGLEGSKFNSLFNIGITTSKNYNEGGTLEIDETKLRKALEEDPDAVERLFKNDSGKKDDVIYQKDKDGNKIPDINNPGQFLTEKADTRGYFNKLRDSMKTFEISIDKKAGRSTMTDTQYSIGKSLKDTEKRISTWQDKLKNIEARYWKQFSAMETAINKANQQSSIFMQGQ